MEDEKVEGSKIDDKNIKNESGSQLSIKETDLSI
jgi:hypothetical protein